MYAWIFQVSSFFQVSPPKPSMRLSPPKNSQKQREITLFLTHQILRITCIDNKNYIILGDIYTNTRSVQLIPTFWIRIISLISWWTAY
jgi:hypothetical protein